MSELTIEFHQMFLLINRTNGATVLLPSAGHTARLSGTILDETLTLNQVDVIVRRDGEDLADMPTLRPGAKYLPYLNYVFHAPVKPLPASKSEIVPTTLNARVLLAGGYLTELPASNRNYTDVMWTFLKPDGRSTLTQQLTDRLRFTLPMDEGVTYQLILRNQSGEEQVWDIPPGGANFVLLNQDTGPVKTRRVAGKGTQLVEYAILYNLTTASEFVTLYPFPTANLSGVGVEYGGSGGGEEPICGGGQSDGDDDPPPGLR